MIYVEQNVAVVLSGCILLRSHQQSKEQGAIAKIIGKYGPGDILGYSPIDKGVTQHPDNWLLAKSYVEIMWIST